MEDNQAGGSHGSAADPSTRESDPVVVLECHDPSSHGGFDFKRQYWKAVLDATHDPFIDDHHDPQDPAKRRRNGSRRIAAPRSSTGRDLKRAVFRRLALRRMRVVMLDEAQHMTDTDRQDRLKKHMNAIKSFGLRSGIKQLLVGTEELLPLLRLNGQLSRRTVEVHFDAYDFTRDAEREAFSLALRDLLRALPCADEDECRKHCAEFFQYSAGGVGVLKDWISIALARAVKRGEEAVDYRRIVECQLPPARLEAIASGVTAFRFMRGNHGSMESIRAQLGLPPSKKRRKQRKPKDKPDAAGGGAPFGRQPGECSPRRDPAYAATGVPEFLATESEAEAEEEEAEEEEAEEEEAEEEEAEEEEAEEEEAEEEEAEEEER